MSGYYEDSYEDWQYNVWSNQQQALKEKLRREMKEHQEECLKAAERRQAIDEVWKELEDKIDAWNEDGYNMHVNELLGFEDLPDARAFRYNLTPEETRIYEGYQGPYGDERDEWNYDPWGYNSKGEYGAAKTTYDGAYNRHGEKMDDVYKKEPENNYHGAYKGIDNPNNQFAKDLANGKLPLPWDYDEYPTNSIYDRYSITPSEQGGPKVISEPMSAPSEMSGVISQPMQEVHHPSGYSMPRELWDSFTKTTLPAVDLRPLLGAMTFPMFYQGAKKY